MLQVYGIYVVSCLFLLAILILLVFFEAWRYETATEPKTIVEHREHLIHALYVLESSVQLGVDEKDSC